MNVNAEPRQAALAARGVTKHFPGVVANEGVDFELLRGEVHALLGENGSGKTTLCKILAGLYRPDGGDVLIDGQAVQLRSPADASAAGVFMVHQHFSLVDRMSVAENVVLGWSRHRQFWFDRRTVEAEVRAAGQRFGIEVDPEAQVWQLSVGERQRVEILKALYRGARVLILDEPTTVLTPQESQHLFSTLRSMASGGSSIVFISHKLHEVLAVCDRVTVLRHGRKTGEVDLSLAGSERVDTRALASMMVGREIGLTTRERGSPADLGEAVLDVRDLVVRNDFDRPVVRGVSFEVRAGEILGLAGVAGNGQRELAEAIAGVRRHSAGRINLDGRALRSGDVRRAITRGVAFVPEDRVGVGLAPGLTVAENLILKSARTGSLSRGPFLRAERIRDHAAELVAQFDVRGTPETLVRQLSGGNAQKVLLAREISSAPRLLVIASPTRGLDVAAMEAIRKLLSDSADAGVAILMISEDLDEILDLTDRVAVMCGGKIIGIRESATADTEEIGLLMMGAEAA